MSEKHYLGDRIQVHLSCIPESRKVLLGVKAMKNPARHEHNEKDVNNCAWVFRKSESTTYEEKYSIISINITQISHDSFPVNITNNLFVWFMKIDPYHEDRERDGHVFSRLLQLIGLSFPQLVNAAFNVTALMPRFSVIYFVYFSRLQFCFTKQLNYHSQSRWYFQYIHKTTSRLSFVIWY